MIINELTNSIKNYSRELGFSDCGILPARFLSEEEEHLLSWLGKGYQGTMKYLARDTRKRLDPAKLADGALTVIMVLQSYNSRAIQTDPDAPVISRYARGRDYHTVIKSKLHHLLNFIQSLLPGTTGRIFADSAPILEKAWARCAGLGWIGKNSLLISPRYGSFCFLGGIVLDQSLPVNPINPVADHCGSCTLCIEACPTGALVAPKTLDARKCISYQTVETKEGPDPALSGKFRNRAYGCDICQEVCPWNRRAPENAEKDFAPSPALLTMSAGEWNRIDYTQFRELFLHTPVMRAGFEKLKKNISFIRNPENR